jgi:UDP-glucose 4-epimerase
MKKPSTGPKWKNVLFRIFNPAGDHLSVFLGEDRGRMPNYFMSYAQQVAIGRRPSLIVLENGYATIDGSGCWKHCKVQAKPMTQEISWIS